MFRDMGDLLHLRMYQPDKDLFLDLELANYIQELTIIATIIVRRLSFSILLLFPGLKRRVLPPVAFIKEALYLIALMI